MRNEVLIDLLLHPERTDPPAATLYLPLLYRHRMKEAGQALTASESKVAALEAEVREAKQYALKLAWALHNKHFPAVSGWKPLDDLLGILTQIDNMTSALSTAPEPTLVGPKVKRPDMAFIMKLWRSCGGSQHGPHTETVTMPLEKFECFCTSFLASCLADTKSEDGA